MGDVFVMEEVNGDINKSLVSPQSKSFESAPKTPGQKLLYLLSSPSRYIQKKFQAGGLKGSMFTILAATVGAGILSLPYAVNLSGLYQGLFLFIFGMIISLYTCQLLVVSAEKTGKLTYESIAEVLYGPRMKTFAEVNMIINNYGTAIGYLVLLKDLVPNCLNLFGVSNSVLLSPFLWGCTITAAIVYPLSLKQEISALRYTSVLSTIACVYLAIAIMIEFFSKTSDTNQVFADAPAFRLEAYNIFTAISYVVFAFTSHPNVIPIYQELNRRSTKRGFKFLSRGLIIVLVLYLVVGVFGFLTFYDKYHPETAFPQQILQAKYGKQNIPIIIASLAIFVTVLCGTPLLMHPCRDATLSILYKRQPTKKQYFWVVTLICFSALGLALVIPSIGYVLNVLGTISNPIICFILPCMFYIKAFPGKYTRKDLFIAWSTMIIMTLIGISGFIMFWVELFIVT